MNLELIHSKNGSYRIISKSTKKNPALELIAFHLKQSNKLGGIKVGIFSVSLPKFSTHATIYSYISEKTERMSKIKYRKWIKGKRQMQGKNIENWEKENNKILEEIIL